MLEYKFEPLNGNFPRDFTPAHLREKSRFEKSWKEVQKILERELRQLGFRQGSLILQTAHSPSDVRRDGQLYADVRKPEHPGVVVKFDAFDKFQKRYVTMSFECDQFQAWKDNVRAIADAMEALRKVDRYGVSSSGKSNAQYEGYKSLPEAQSMGFSIALTLLSINSSYNEKEIITTRETLKNAYKQAASRLHPDSPVGSHEKFLELQRAKEILEKHFSEKNK